MVRLKATKLLPLQPPMKRFLFQYGVLDIIEEEKDIEELNPSSKQKLLKIPAINVRIDNQSSPLMIAARRTTSSLMRCMEEIERKIIYPVFQ